MPPDWPFNVGWSSHTSLLFLFNPQPSTLTTKKFSALESLPKEMLTYIAKNCQDKDLGQLCLVSKQMADIAGPELYRTVIITSSRRLTRFYHSIIEEPVLGRYIKELKFLAPKATSGPRCLMDLFRGDSCLQWTRYFEVLRRTTNLRRLTVMQGGYGNAAGSIYDWPAIISAIRGIVIDRAWETITESLGDGYTTVILPRLEQFRLISDTRAQDPDAQLADPKILKPFLRLPCLSSLELLNDFGVWSRDYGYMNRAMSLAGYGSEDDEFLPSMFDKPHYEQVKSVVLRESDSFSTAIMDITGLFPALEVFFLQNRLQKSAKAKEAAAESSRNQTRSIQSEKRYLTYAFESMDKLKALALVPAGDTYWAEKTREFLGPDNFLSLTGLGGLESVSALITLFASPDGKTTGLLTVSPVEVLPHSLISLHIVVDHEGLGGLAGETPLNAAWFQPRDAALQFLEELASICNRAFPSLREVEYIWAVDRSTDDDNEGGDMNPPEAHALEDPESTGQMWACDGSVPLCCDMHTTIQALSPDEDYTSRAEGIVSPFKQRFDDLGSAFKEVNVAFQVVELERYSDYFFHWRGDRE